MYNSDVHILILDLLKILFSRGMCVNEEDDIESY